MDRVFSPDKRPFSQIRHAGIGIRSTSPTQRHIGVLYRDSAADTALLLHLAWHHDLCSSTPTDRYIWVDPIIHAARLRQVAALCRKIWRSNGKALPYAFSSPNDCFDAETGRFLLGPSRLGLTCASFVLALFDAAGIPLARYETWPVGRAGDAEWQQWVVEQLRASNPAAPTDHIDAVERQIGAVRFRPEEVAGSVLVIPWLASFEQAIQRSQSIIECLSQLP